MDAAQRGRLLNRLADLMERDAVLLAVRQADWRDREWSLGESSVRFAGDLRLI